MDFKRLSGTIGPTNLPNMTSLAVSGQLQKARKYCTKAHKMGAAGKEAKSLIIWPLFDAESLNLCMDIHANLVYSHNRYDVTSYFRSALSKYDKTAVNYYYVTCA